MPRHFIASPSSSCGLPLGIEKSKIPRSFYYISFFSTRQAVFHHFLSKNFKNGQKSSRTVPFEKMITICCQLMVVLIQLRRDITMKKRASRGITFFLAVRV